MSVKAAFLGFSVLFCFFSHAIKESECCSGVSLLSCSVNANGPPVSCLTLSVFCPHCQISHAVQQEAAAL